MTAALIVVGIVVLLVAEGIGIRNDRKGDTITAHTERRRWTFSLMLALIFWAGAHFVTARRGWELLALVFGAGLGMALHEKARRRDRA